MTNSEFLETTAGFLTEQMREYLKDPAGFEDKYDQEKASKVRHRIRNARSAAVEQLRYLDDNPDQWVREQPKASNFPDSEPHIDTVSLHEPLPDDHTISFGIHTDTHRALAQVQTELSELVVDSLIESLEPDDIPPEFDSKLEYRDYLQINRQDLRTKYDTSKLPQYEVFRGDDLVTVDDIIRIALQMTPTDKMLDEIDINSFAMLPGIRYEERHKVMQTFSNALDRSLLKRN